MGAPFQAQNLSDSLFSFEAGMNAGVAPLLLPKNQLAFFTNGTVRGTFATHRPAYRRIPLSYGGDATVETRFKTGKWQGGAYFKPDNKNGSLMAAINGRLFQVKVIGTNGIVTEHAVAADPTYPNPVGQRQAWLWQAEKWCIYNDGVSLPIFFDGTTSTRSTFGTPVNYTTTTIDTLLIPAIGNPTLATVEITDATNLVVGDIVTVQNRGTFQVLSITPTVAPAAEISFLNLTGTPVGYVVAAGTTISWSHIGVQLPPGRMGVYGMGRNWISLVDGKQFVASDLVGGSSGTVAENYRDAVLNITENLYLAGGGNFTVPGSIGDIKAMRFVAELDKSLGQGPLQVLTPKNAFSCNAPVDRLTWQDVTNPILTESLITNGGLSQNATVLANGDLIFRSVDGIRSLILARRDFNTWGNVPASFEVDPILRTDAQSLLEFSSAAVFNNRLLMTTSPVTHDMGVYWRGLIALNFDPISSLRGKAPSVYDGLWTGLNVFQVITGDFAGTERCFAFTLNTISEEIELYEVQRDIDAYYDNGNSRIVWEFESPVLDFGQRDPKNRQLLRLQDGEIHVDQLLGPVDFQVFYKPDQWPCWVPWHSWSECAKSPSASDPTTANYQPQFRPEMGFGEPSPVPCDETNNRPLREGFSFQVKVVITGHCRVLSMRFGAVSIPQTNYAKMVCDPICVGEDSAQAAELAALGVSLNTSFVAVTQVDGTVVPISSTTTNVLRRIQNMTDNKWYDLVGYTIEDGTVVPICDQTPHSSPL